MCRAAAADRPYKTRAVFECYKIVSARDLRDAAQLAERTSEGIRLGQERLDCKVIANAHPIHQPNAAGAQRGR